MHTHTCIYIHTQHMHPYTCICMHACTCIHMHAHAYARYANTAGVLHGGWTLRNAQMGCFGGALVGHNKTTGRLVLHWHKCAHIFVQVICVIWSMHMRAIGLQGSHSDRLMHTCLHMHAHAHACMYMRAYYMHIHAHHAYTAGFNATITNQRHSPDGCSVESPCSASS